jgi:very-short-patch-repair endonuclease
MAEMDKVAATQLGLSHRTQLTVSRRTLVRRVERGAVEQVQPDVYRSTAFPETPGQRLLAATLSAGQGSAISHRAAAALWGVDRFECDFVELSVPAHRQPRLRDVVLHRSSDLQASDITVLGPFPVTTPARTLVDLGAVSRPWLVSRALEDWVRAGRVTIPEARAALEEVARRGRSGAGVLREVLDSRALGFEVSDSHAEVVLAEALRAHGAPTPVFHHHIRIGHEVFEVDFAYPDVMLAIEVDGYGPHVDRDRHDEDCRRQNLIGDAGYLLRRYSAMRVLSRPHHVAAEIERLRRARVAAA